MRFDAWQDPVAAWPASGVTTFSDALPADRYDVVVAGSGAAALMAAAVAADRGLAVLVLERSGLLGGTSSISAGTVWVPCHPYRAEAGEADDPAEALRYLTAVAAGRGRAGVLGPLASALRRDPVPPYTMAEFKAWGSWNAFPWDELRTRAEEGWVARGGALVAPLLAACAARGVQFAVNSRVDGSRSPARRRPASALIAAATVTTLLSAGTGTPIRWHGHLPAPGLPSGLDPSGFRRTDPNRYRSLPRPPLLAPGKGRPGAQGTDTAIVVRGKTE